MSAHQEVMVARMQAVSASSSGLAGTKLTALTILLVSEVAAMSTWFATTASLASIRAGWSLTPFHEALLTSSVQAGFVAGTLISAVTSLADRVDLRTLFSASAAVAGAANLLIVLFPPNHPAVPVLRFLTGLCMAGVYPVGMKLASTWAAGDLGLLIGLLVAALTLGSATPNLIASAGGLDWRLPCLGAALGAILAAGLIRFATVGPRLVKAPLFQLGNALQAWRVRPLRLANLGYLGHMWELYAMWAWIGAFMAASFRQSGHAWNPYLATFLVIASGAVGALLGGWSADRVGRTLVTSLSMAVSGACALIIGFAFGGPPVVVLGIGVLWGMSVIADSAQFSAAVAELSAANLVGTMLTVQTCLGFVLTLISIHLMPYVVALVGWQFAFAALAIGPFLGIVAMLRLREAPEARRLAGGHR
jgi:MFS family permease